MVVDVWRCGTSRELRRYNRVTVMRREKEGAMNLFDETTSTSSVPAQVPVPVAVPVAAKRKTVYTVIEREGMEKNLWVRIGIGFVNRDGSINIHLNALPINGQIHVRDYDPERDGARSVGSTNGSNGAAGAERR
jgi:hypothetical protein